MIASLLIDYFVEKDIEFNHLGSFTQEKGEEVSPQADESFLIGKSTGITPDRSIKVVFTSGGKRKLTRYQALGVPEVWFWRMEYLACIICDRTVMKKLTKAKFCPV
jgi:Uma2 family endonuclease